MPCGSRRGFMQALNPIVDAHQAPKLPISTEQCLQMIDDMYAANDMVLRLLVRLPHVIHGPVQIAYMALVWHIALYI